MGLAAGAELEEAAGTDDGLSAGEIGATEDGLDPDVEVGWAAFVHPSTANKPNINIKKINLL